ncbi:MAG: putative exported protein, partial [Conexibacter sp.]|nr:putative exported protein [Conexibacter sp.]
TAVAALGCGSVAAVGCGSGSSSEESSASSGAGQQKTLTYGLLTAVSGSAATYGVAESTSVKLGINQVNQAGGIKVGADTYKLKVKVYDQAYDPTKAATAASQAIQQDGLKFVEDLGGGTVAAVQPIAERAGAVVFCSCSGADFLGDKHPLTFRPYFDDPDSLAASLKYFKEKHPDATQVAQLYPDDDVGHGAAPATQASIKQLGLSSKVYYVERGGTDYTPVLTKVLQGKPDVIDFGPSDAGSYQAMIKQAFELGYKGPYIFPDTLDFAGTVKAVPKGSLTGSITTPCNLEAVTPVAKAWAAEYKTMAGEDPQWWAAQSHDNVLLLAKAIEKAQSVDPTKVAEALGSVSVAGATAGGGTVSYGGAERFGKPRAFKVPYPACTVSAGSKLVQAGA